ncbi:MAG: hypothetical protein M5R41_14680 [Bacteroidia bacterium]|nr:hypothetical protein [Bacteroidia bacterium]
MDENEKRRLRNQRYYSRHRDKLLRSVNRKYKESEEYRDNMLQRSRDRYHEDESYRNATIDRAKERYKKSRGDGATD